MTIAQDQNDQELAHPRGLVTLKEYTARQLLWHEQKYRTDIACPTCKTEPLYDHENSYGVLSLSNPPTKQVYCKKCQGRWTVYA